MYFSNNNVLLFHIYMYRSEYFLHIYIYMYKFTFFNFVMPQFGTTFVQINFFLIINFLIGLHSVPHNGKVKTEFYKRLYCKLIKKKVL